VTSYYNLSNVQAVSLQTGFQSGPLSYVQADSLQTGFQSGPQTCRQTLQLEDWVPVWSTE